jgi:acetyl-CoA decarbonylase/synthase complex subunit gamma
LSTSNNLRDVSPIDIFKLLPKTNCKKCGVSNCLAFAAKLASREIKLELCIPLLEEKKYAEAYAELFQMLSPPVKEITIGTGEKAVKIGGKYVMYRHELALHNPTPIAIDVTDEMPDEELIQRVRKADSFSYLYIGKELKLNMIAVRSTSDSPAKFRASVEKVMENTQLPLILCSLNPKVIDAGLLAAANSRPLIYAATRDNWKDMAELALSHNCPLTVSASNDLKLLKSLAATIVDYGVKDLVLDPGTFPYRGLSETISSFTMIRRSACKRGDDYLGFPIAGTPITAWTQQNVTSENLSWNEACLASMLIARYADLLIVHSLEGWALLPNVVLRENLYSDPRKPVAVEPGIKVFGNPDESSPVLLTTNFALTYYTVASDLESAAVSCFLIIVDSEGLAVDCAVAGRKLTAEGIAEALKKNQTEAKVKHRKLIIPGKAAKLRDEIQELSGWEVLIGPQDSSGIPGFLQERWRKT